MHGSDDEVVDESLERDSDEDLTDDGPKLVDEEVCRILPFSCQTIILVVLGSIELI